MQQPNEQNPQLPVTAARWVTPKRVILAASLLLAFAALLVWWSSRSLIRKIESAGGTWGAYYSSDREQTVMNLFRSKLIPDGRLQWVYLKGGRIDDDWLRRFGGLPHLGHFDFIETSFTDVGLEFLKNVPKVESLRLANCPHLTDAGLKHLGDLSDLVHLELRDINLTDAGAVHLSRLSELYMLDLRGTRITDVGLVHLAKLTKLRHLYLSRTGVTDRGLTHLTGLTGLRDLHLYGTKVTKAGIDQLQRTLPGSHIPYLGSDPTELP